MHLLEKLHPYQGDYKHINKLFNVLDKHEIQFCWKFKGIKTYLTLKYI